MHFDTERELHRSMTQHLHAGITPAQFEMDGLRLDEMRLSARQMAVAARDKARPDIDVRPTWSGKFLADAAAYLHQLSIQWPSSKLLRQ